MTNFTVRPASANDVNDVVPLLLASGREALVWTYGLGNEQRCTNFLKSAYVREDTIFSWPFATVAVNEENVVVGLLYLLDRDTVEACAGTSIAHLFRYFGFSMGAWTYWRTIRLGRSLPEPKPNCLHLSGFSIREDCRGEGLFRQFVDFAAEQARSEDLDALSLDVGKLNKHAITCYQALGFKLQYTRPAPAKGLHGYAYYTKALEEIWDDEDD
jgi:ribosomal protein S18 acetylase RimI-like enzyme